MFWRPFKYTGELSWQKKNDTKLYIQYDADFIKNIYSHSKTIERKKPNYERGCYLFSIRRQCTFVTRKKKMFLKFGNI